MDVFVSNGTSGNPYKPPEEMTESELDVAKATANVIAYYPEPGGLPTHPAWTESYRVEDKLTMEFLGFVGRLGMSETWEYTDGLPGSRCTGRARGRDVATLMLYQLAEKT